MKYKNDFTAFSGLKGKPALILDCWIAEYQARQELSENNRILQEPKFSEHDLRKLQDTVSPFNDNLAPGQIRIWSSEMVTNKEIPPYFVILAEWEDDMWLVAPFSTMGTPANEGEMTTGLKIPFCNVLQCWNARTVQSCLVSRSWIVDSMPENITQGARDLFLNQIFGDDLPGEFPFLRGGPIMNPLDPRVLFLKESKKQFSPLFQKVMDLNFLRGQQRILLFTPQQEDEEFQLAAADSHETITKHFKVPQYNCTVTVVIEPDEDPEIFVTNENDEDASILDGFSIRNKSEKRLADFQSGHAFIPKSAFDGTLLVTSPDGWPIELKEKQK